MIRSQQVMRAARDAVIAARFQGGPAPVNPHRRDTRSHIWWNLAARRAERAVADLMEIG